MQRQGLAFQPKPQQVQFHSLISHFVACSHLHRTAAPALTLAAMKRTASVLAPTRRRNGSGDSRCCSACHMSHSSLHVEMFTPARSSLFLSSPSLPLLDSCATINDGSESCSEASHPFTFTPALQHSPASSTTWRVLAVHAAAAALPLSLSLALLLLPQPFACPSSASNSTAACSADDASCTRCSDDASCSSSL